MPDENVNLTTKQETTEVVSPPGASNEGVKSLSSMFDKIIEGKEEGKSAAEVVAEQPKVVEREQAEEVERKPAKSQDKPAEKPVEMQDEGLSDLSKRLDATQAKKDEGEVTRDKLKEATEAKPVEAKPVAQDKADEVPEDELKVLPHDKPKTAKRIQALLKKIDDVNAEVARTKSEATEKASKLAELEKKLGEVKTVDPTTDAKIKEQLDELAMYRRRYELDKDPEVKTKFDSRVESAEAAITATLIKNTAGEALLKVIKDEGGWAKFAESSRLVSINDGEGGTKQITTAELADNILQRLPLGDRKSVEAAMMEQIQTKRDRDRYFKEQQDTAVEYFKRRDELTAQQAAEQQRQFDQAKKAIEEFEQKTLQSEWLQDKVPDPKATAAEKAQIEEYNRYNSQLRSVLKKSIGAKGLDELLTIVSDSVRYYDERRTSSGLRRENEKLKADLAAKQAELDRFKGAGRSVPKTGSISTSQSSDSYRDEPPTSLTAALDRIQRGERLGVKDED